MSASIDGMLTWSGDISSLSHAAADVTDSRRRLIEGILYNRWLVQSYQGVGLAVFAIFTNWSLCGRLQRIARRSTGRRPSTHDNEPYIDEGGTRRDSAASLVPQPAKDVDESTPLIGVAIKTEQLNVFRRLWGSGRGIIAYQPPNIPLLQRVSPPISSLIFLAALYGINIFYLVYNLAFERAIVFVWADRAGLLFVANLPWLYLLGAKNQPIGMLTGYSYERVNFVHRRLGEVVCFYAFLHTGLMFVGWYDSLRPIGLTLLDFITTHTIWTGLVAFLCYEVLLLTSQPWFRKLCYEIFLALHIVLQAAGLGFLYFHYPPCRIYCVISLAIFMVDRLIFRAMMKSYSSTAELTVMEDGETVLVSADWSLSPRSGFLRSIFTSRSVQSGWKPSQHVFITIPSMGIKHGLQAHPFTIASAAPSSTTDHAWLNLIVRAHKGFSSDLLTHARNRHSVNVRLDGPYGSLHALDMLQDSDISIVVAGGSGIAVAYPLIWSLLHEEPRTSIRGNNRQISLVWIVHSQSHIDWIGQERLKELQALGLHFYLPLPTSQGGRPDMELLTTQVIYEAIAQVQVADPKIGVIVSGPDGMNRTVRNVCAREAWKGRDIDVCVEKYGW